MGIFQNYRSAAAVLAFGALLVSAEFAHAADVSGMVQDSDAIESARKMHSVRPFSLMFSSSFQTPGLNNLDSHLNKMDMVPDEGGSAGVNRHARNATATCDPEASGTSSHSAGHGGHQPGYRLRHTLAANYEFTPGYLLGPALDVSEPFSGRRKGQLTIEDPQLRFTILDLYQAKVGENNLHSNMMISASFPVSDNSRRRSSWGGLSVSTSPRLHFHGTPYSISGHCSVKTGLYGRNEAGPLISTRLSTGIQGGYRISRSLESGLMFHAGSQFGPDIPVEDGEGFFKERGTQVFGLMPSLRYQFNDVLSFTPRMDWYLDQPIRTTTISVSAMMRLI
ncbi:MAG: hypothetical protein ACJ763_11790 [Bdellovibrionia bacterium]